MDERERRRAMVEDAIHSAEMEGGSVREEWKRDAQDYIDGRITAEEKLRRTMARYGLDVS